MRTRFLLVILVVAMLGLGICGIGMVLEPRQQSTLAQSCEPTPTTIPTPPGEQAQFTHLTAGSAHTVPNTSTAPVLIPANHLALVWAGSGDGIPTVTGASRNWTLVGGINAGRGLALYQSISGMDTNESITISAPIATDITWSAMHVDRTMVAQFKVTTVTELQTQINISLPSTGSGVVAMGMFSLRSARPYTAGTGYSMIGPNGCDVGPGYSILCTQIEGRPDFSQTATMGLSMPAHWSAVMVEVQ